MKKIYCTKNIDTNTVGRRRTLRSGDTVIEINCHGVTREGVQGTLRDELQHVRDKCSNKIDYNKCGGSICSEIRAYLVGQFLDATDLDKLKDELKDYIKASARSFCKEISHQNMDLLEEFDRGFNEYYEKVFSKCAKGETDFR